MALTGFSTTTTITDDRGNALKGVAIGVTGPGGYSSTVTTSTLDGSLRLGPLPIGDYTLTYQGRSNTVQVVPSAGQLQKVADDATLALALDGDSAAVQNALAGKLDITTASATYPRRVVIAGTGIDPTGAADSYAAVQEKLTFALSLGIPVEFPSCLLKLSQTLIVDGRLTIRGAGRMTELKTTGNFPALRIGKLTDAAGGPLATDSLSGLVISSGAPSKTGVGAGLVISGLPQYRVQDVSVFGYPVGIDIINNCYGARFDNCRVWFFDARIGVRLREGGMSGNDIVFTNCWFGGRDAAVWVDPGGAGFHFFGGQLNAGEGLAAADDLLGAVVLGKHLETGVTGQVGNINLNGPDFEQIQNVWVVRSFSQAQVNLSNSALLANGAAAGLGVYKADGFAGSKVRLESLRVRGTWTAVALLVFNGVNSNGFLSEDGTDLEATVNSSVVNDRGLIDQSNVFGLAVQRRNNNTQLLLDQLALRSNSGLLERSTDDGVTWLDVDPGAVVEVATANMTSSSTGGVYTTVYTTASIVAKSDKVFVSLLGFSSGTATGSFSAFRIGNGLTTKQAGSVDSNGGQQLSHACGALFTGLTPGTAYTYTVQVMVGTGSWNCRPASFPASEQLAVRVESAR